MSIKYFTNCQRPIVDLIIDPFLLKNCQKKRSQRGYDISRVCVKKRVLPNGGHKKLSILIVIKQKVWLMFNGIILTYHNHLLISSICRPKYFDQMLEFLPQLNRLTSNFRLHCMLKAVSIGEIRPIFPDDVEIHFSIIIALLLLNRPYEPFATIVPISCLWK